MFSAYKKLCTKNAMTQLLNKTHGLCIPIPPKACRDCKVREGQSLCVPLWEAFVHCTCTLVPHTCTTCRLGCESSLSEFTTNKLKHLNYILVYSAERVLMAPRFITQCCWNPESYSELFRGCWFDHNSTAVAVV